MIFFLKSLSRSVHDQEHHHEPIAEAEAEVETRMNDGKCTSLTVWRKSLLISCNGFTVISSCGGIVYRVDNYIDRPEELILMDGSGKSILTIRRRKKLGVPVNSWFIYEGEVGNYCATNKLSKKPIWCVRKNINILQTNHNVLAYVFRGSTDKRHSFVIEGSYTHRSCKVLGGSREVLAEITRKEAIVEGVSYGVEVFVLNVEPGFDPGFAMGLLLILDQMFP
uniref:Protein LURP-one-related 17 n=1 Tax=Salix viminalis TaxID=40686 RepID=A0A6N2KAV3_SALVM